MKPKRDTRVLRRRKRIIYSADSYSDADSESTSDVSTESAEDPVGSEVPDVVESAKQFPAAAHAPEVAEASASPSPEPLFSIPKKIQLKIPQMWHLNTALQNVYRGKPFPPHIDVAQLIKSFFRSNVFTEGDHEHRAITRATSAMEGIYYNYFIDTPWYRWWLPDPAGPVRDDEVGMYVERGPPPYLSPSTILAAVCAHAGKDFPPENWSNFWHLFEWMLHDPSSWPEIMPPFWKDSRFDDQAWIAQNFQPEIRTTSTVPPELGAEDVNAWLHGPGVMRTEWKAALGNPKFPTDWKWYLKSKWERILPAPNWIRDALDAPKAQPTAATEPGQSVENQNIEMAEMGLGVPAQPAEPAEHSVVVNSGPSTSTQPLSSAFPILNSTLGVPVTPGSAQGVFTPGPGASHSPTEARMPQLYQYVEGMTPDSGWEERYQHGIFALTELQRAMINICNGSPEDINEAMDGLRGISQNIKAGKDRIIQNSLDREAAYHKLIDNFLAEQARLRQAIAQSEQHVQDSEIMLRRLEAELIKRSGTAYMAGKRQTTHHPSGSISSSQEFLRENDLAIMDPVSHGGKRTNHTNQSDIEILRATYRDEYLATYWPGYKRVISQFMPIWNRFTKQDWQNGFRMFKEKLERESVAVGATVPTEEALALIYKIEMRARGEMGCWDTARNRELPTISAVDVFREA